MNEKTKRPERANAPERNFTAEEVAGSLRLCTGMKPLNEQAADLIEAQAKRIAELEELTAWRDPVNDPPTQFEPVLVCRVKDPTEPPIVEQGHRERGGWWKVYGARVKKIIGWMPMPKGMEAANAQN